MAAVPEMRRNMQYTESERLFEASKKCIPGGVNSPVRAYQAVHRTPVFVERASGSHIYDVDGNAYIDYVCSWGPCILGHAYLRVIKAVQAACENGLTYGAPTGKELKLAELIRSCIPSMEVSRLVSSGTEATMSAIRVARGFTGRDKVVKFRGCYHGHSDGLLVKAGSGALTQSVPDSKGVPADYTKNTLVAEYNQPDSVQKLFETQGKEIAAIIVEPVAANMGVVLPEPGFLEFLRKITEDYGALLIFDEVITGFRLGIGGAQGYFHVTPDLTTLGKIIGGGMPGRRIRRQKRDHGYGCAGRTGIPGGNAFRQPDRNDGRHRDAYHLKRDAGNLHTDRSKCEDACGGHARTFWRKRLRESDRIADEHFLYCPESKGL